jgi:hypothetical protein
LPPPSMGAQEYGCIKRAKPLSEAAG